MLTEYEKFRLIDEAGKNEFYVEVNWKEKDEATNKCQIFKFTFPDGKEAFVQRKYLLDLLFYCGKPEDQQKMIPQTLETIHHYKTVLGIKATKDIKKDGMINFPVELSIPCSALRQDVIASLPKEYQKGKFSGIGNGKSMSFGG